MKKNLLIILFSIFFIGSSFSQDQSKEEINQMLDNWHMAASNVDQENYFSYLADDGIYIGTDASEIWTRDDFYKWSTPHFEKGKAWSFTASSRNIYLSDDGNIAWFDELLDFSGGELRGSGVLQKTSDGWKIKHYVLSLPIPNEKFKNVVDVLTKEAEPIEKEE
jgi:ketosteroid isomerase-like protein